MKRKSLGTLLCVDRRLTVFVWYLGLCLLCVPVASPAEEFERTEQISAWIQEADTYAEQGELTAAYDIYLRVAGLEPGNTHARAQIFTILREYQSRVVSASGEEEDNGYRELHLQRYRFGVRDLLYALTTRLKQNIERYGERVAALKSGRDWAAEIPPLLVDIIAILGDITTVYEEFPQNDADASAAPKIVERLKQTIAKYEQELDFYTQTMNTDIP